MPWQWNPPQYTTTYVPPTDPMQISFGASAASAGGGLWNAQNLGNINSLYEGPGSPILNNPPIYTPPPTIYNPPVYLGGPPDGGTGGAPPGPINPGTTPTPVSGGGGSAELPSLTGNVVNPFAAPGAQPLDPSLFYNGPYMLPMNPGYTEPPNSQVSYSNGPALPPNPSDFGYEEGFAKQINPSNYPPYSGSNTAMMPPPAYAGYPYPQPAGAPINPSNPGIGVAPEPGYPFPNPLGTGTRPTGGTGPIDTGTAPTMGPEPGYPFPTSGTGTRDSGNYYGPTPFDISGTTNIGGGTGIKGGDIGTAPVAPSASSISNPAAWTGQPGYLEQFYNMLNPAMQALVPTNPNNLDIGQAPQMPSNPIDIGTPPTMGTSQATSPFNIGTAPTWSGFPSNGNLMNPSPQIPQDSNSWQQNRNIETSVNMQGGRHLPVRRTLWNINTNSQELPLMLGILSAAGIDPQAAMGEFRAFLPRGGRVPATVF